MAHFANVQVSIQMLLSKINLKNDFTYKRFVPAKTELSASAELFCAHRLLVWCGFLPQ